MRSLTPPIALNRNAPTNTPSAKQTPNAPLFLNTAKASATHPKLAGLCASMAIKTPSTSPSVLQRTIVFRKSTPSPWLDLRNALRSIVRPKSKPVRMTPGVSVLLSSVITNATPQNHAGLNVSKEPKKETPRCT